MKQLSKKLISITLIIAMVFSNTITNFAIDDLTLGEKKSVELVSTEGENELFVATDSETDDENKKLTEEENDDDTATASELDDETTKNEITQSSF